MSKKQSALEHYLELPHRKTCMYWVFSGDRHCSCGRDAARKELEELRANVPNLCPECGVELHLTTEGQNLCLNEVCERYGE